MSDEMSKISIFLQVFTGVVLILVLVAISYLIYNYEKVKTAIFVNAGALKKEIIITNGIADFSTINNLRFDTYNKNISNYKDLTPSINQQGGAEYSYNFWLYKDNNILKNEIKTSDIILFLRGSTMKVPYINNTNCELVNGNTYILVKNPLIRMKADGSAIIIEYNTITNPDSYHEYGNNEIDCSSSDWYDRNKGLLGIYNLGQYVYDKKWFMVTIVLREITPENDILYKYKTSCKMYINGLNVLDRIVESPYGAGYGSAVMKHNRGPLYINPGDLFSRTRPTDRLFDGDKKEKALRLANLSYFNYSLTDDVIAGLFKRGFTKDPIKIEKDISPSEDLYTIAPVRENDNNFPLPF